jgi:Holliday junction resolvase RusA-like endonuclease
MISFVIAGEMRGKQRPRMTRGGHVYTPTETRLAEAKVAKLAREAMGRRMPMSGAIALNIIVLTEPPKSAGKAEREQMLTGLKYPTKKPDLDNIVKLISDALNGIVYHDDRQIVSLWIIKEYAEIARTTVQIGTLAGRSDEA